MKAAALSWGVVLAGGTGSRMGALTRATNKHLLPLGPYPMIYHPLVTLARGGIEQAVIVVGAEHAGHMIETLGSRARLPGMPKGSQGVELIYRVQERPGGIGEAIKLCEPILRGQRFVVHLGDNYFARGAAAFVEAFRAQPRGARVLLTPMDASQARRFGVAKLAGLPHRVVDIVEKPQTIEGSEALVVTGLYGFDERAFAFLDVQKRSARGELEVTDLNLRYAQIGELEHNFWSDLWTDAGTPESYHAANVAAWDLTEE